MFGIVLHQVLTLLNCYIHTTHPCALLIIDCPLVLANVALFVDIAQLLKGTIALWIVVLVSHLSFMADVEIKQHPPPAKYASPVVKAVVDRKNATRMKKPVKDYKCNTAVGQV